MLTFFETLVKFFWPHPAAKKDLWIWGTGDAYCPQECMHVQFIYQFQKEAHPTTASRASETWLFPLLQCLHRCRTGNPELQQLRLAPVVHLKFFQPWMHQVWKSVTLLDESSYAPLSWYRSTRLCWNATRLWFSRLTWWPISVLSRWYRSGLARNWLLIFCCFGMFWPCGTAGMCSPYLSRI